MEEAARRNVEREDTARREFFEQKSKDEAELKKKINLEKTLRNRMKDGIVSEEEPMEPMDL